MMHANLEEEPFSGSGSWFDNYWDRQRVREQVRARRVPRLHWFWSDDFNEVERLIFDRTRNAARVLDFGAGDLRLKRKFLAAGYAGEYHTLDRSTEHDHDYHRLQDVKGQYDAILCLEVIEHITLSDYTALMDGLYRLLCPGGIMIVSTPNPLCVVPMWAGDASHIQQYPLADLTADFEVRGYQTETFRVCWGKRPQLWRAGRFLVTRLLCYFLNVDYAHGLLVIGTKRFEPRSNQADR